MSRQQQTAPTDDATCHGKDRKRKQKNSYPLWWRDPKSQFEPWREWQICGHYRTEEERQRIIDKHKRLRYSTTLEFSTEDPNE